MVEREALVIMENGFLRIKLHGTIVGRKGRLVLAQFAQGVSSAVISGSKGRIDLDGPVICLQRIFVPPQLPEGIALAIVAGGKVGSEKHSLLIGCERILVAPQCIERVSPIVPGILVVSVATDCLLIRGQRLLVLPAALEGFPFLVIGGSGVGIKKNGTLISYDSLRILPGLIAHIPLVEPLHFTPVRSIGSLHGRLVLRSNRNRCIRWRRGRWGRRFIHSWSRGIRGRRVQGFEKSADCRETITPLLRHCLEDSLLDRRGERGIEQARGRRLLLGMLI